MLIPFDLLFKKYNIQSTSVLHLGANTGQEAEAYHVQGIKQVIWVEANADLLPALEQHIKIYPGQRALCACVSDEMDQLVTFHIANNQGQSSSFLELGTHLKEHPSVHYTRHVKMRTVRVDKLFDMCGISAGDGGWFLNADLQGAELLALKGMGDLLWKFDWVYCEVNIRELYKGCALMSEIDTYLWDFGLQGCETKMTNAGWGDRLYGRVR